MSKELGKHGEAAICGIPISPDRSRHLPRGMKHNEGHLLEHGSQARAMATPA